MANGEEQKTGNKNGLSMETLKQMNWPTVILIIVTGGGNFLATQNNSSQRQYQVDRAIDQIREMHQALDETDRRQRDYLAKVESLLSNDKQEIGQLGTALSNQTQMLENQNKVMKLQTQILENDTATLSQVSAIVHKFERWKELEQQRGAPGVPH